MEDLRSPGDAYFWTPTLQKLLDTRDQAHRAWKRCSNGLNKALKWIDYTDAMALYWIELKRERRETWKKFCSKLSDGSFSETTSIIKKLRRKKVISPSFSQPEGPKAAATEMARHLRGVFSGDTLPELRPSAPLIPIGPAITDRDQPLFHDLLKIRMPKLIPPKPAIGGVCIPPVACDYKLGECPFTVDEVIISLQYKLARRKAHGVDHLRAEMLLPICDAIAPIRAMLYSLCWIWSIVPKAWNTAEVAPIFKKGDPLQAANYRPISLRSILRKLMEMCLTRTLHATSPDLDIVQGGCSKSRL
ncbi:uncharacterized protein EV154DRAFT_604592 [Mucor mucedo]|uniref:uncharacterized protein n=1 Tax=Mucor mucedo TaxID=29922 RepID=UPI00221E7B35|nr:uncharacterized protein EV154DRAFT_604592 [Mucor mucedo]KAI7888787.1 hypothetical protein EV154DRAFT_604592 [Mucor mucedo]